MELLSADEDAPGSPVMVAASTGWKIMDFVMWLVPLDLERFLSNSISDSIKNAYLSNLAKLSSPVPNPQPPRPSPNPVKSSQNQFERDWG